MSRGAAPNIRLAAGRIHRAIKRCPRLLPVAQLTTNLDDQGDPACFLIEAGTPDGIAAGLVQDCLFAGYLISLMSEDRLHDVIGKLSGEAMRRVDECLKAALGLAHEIRTRAGYRTRIAAAFDGENPAMALNKFC